MKEMLTELHDAALSQLNPSVLSSDSFRAMIYLLFGIGISVFFIKKLRGIVSWWIGLTLFVEIMHFITYQTPLGTMFPICQTLFKYDVFSMFAQLCVGARSYSCRKSMPFPWQSGWNYQFASPTAPWQGIPNGKK